MNRDQRELLAKTNAEELLLDDGAWDRLMTTQAGYAGHCREGRGVIAYECRRPKITGRFNDGTTVTIIRGDITAWRRQIPPPVLAVLAAARKARWDEDERTRAWCMCPVQRGDTDRCCGELPWEPKRVHPSDAEYAEHIRRWGLIRERLSVAWLAALGLADEPAPGEQMALFA